MYPFKYQVSLRFHHPEMAPDYICNVLGLKAMFKWKAGDKRITPQGKPLSGVYETTYCCFDLEHSPDILLADFLKQYNKKLYKHKSFLESVRSTGGDFGYYIGWFSGNMSGEIFDLELLKQLTELGIDLALSVYCGQKTKRKRAKEKSKKTKSRKSKMENKKRGQFT